MLESDELKELHGDLKSISGSPSKIDNWSHTDSLAEAGLSSPQLRYDVATHSKRTEIPLAKKLIGLCFIINPPFRFSSVKFFLKLSALWSKLTGISYL